jgi:beta-glucosidase
LYLDGQKVTDVWESHHDGCDTVAIRLEGGRDYNLKAEFQNIRDYSLARLSWKIPTPATNERLALYGRAGELAKECDAVVAVMGINRTIEREGKDRDEITLPADQQEFLQELVKVNPNIILVLVAGSSLSLNWEQENLPAIVNAWYPGEKGGTAVAEVLFGQYNPAGRLPLTFYRSMSDLPPFNDYDITKRTYKYFEKEVLYPFGYGLSYTQFKYSGLNVEDKGENVDVTFTLENTGECDGDEVAQVYTRLSEYEGKAPLKELRGFKRVHLKRGESKEVTIHLRREDLRYWSESNKQFVVPQGLPKVMVGASSADIRLEK